MINSAFHWCVLCHVQMVQKTAAMATRVSSCGAPGCLKQYMQLEKGNPPGALMGLMIAGRGRADGWGLGGWLLRWVALMSFEG